jgi:NAD-dependent DNA ligase
MTQQGLSAVDEDGAITAEFIETLNSLLMVSDKSIKKRIGQLRNKLSSLNNSKILKTDENQELNDMASLVGYKLLAIPRVGITATSSLILFVANKKTREMVEALTKEINIRPTTIQAVNTPSLPLPRVIKKGRLESEESLMIDHKDENQSFSSSNTSVDSSNIDNALKSKSRVKDDFSIPGKSIAFTGKFSVMTRAQAIDICEKLGE